MAFCKAINWALLGPIWGGMWGIAWGGTLRAEKQGGEFLLM